METVESDISGTCPDLQDMLQQVNENVARQMQAYFDQQIKQIPMLVSKTTADLLGSNSGFKNAIDSGVAQSQERLRRHVRTFVTDNVLSQILKDMDNAVA